MAAETFYDLVLEGQQVGFFDIMLPFLLIFAITFAILEKLKLFGDKGRGANIIISAVMGFLFLQNELLILKLQMFLPAASMAIIGIIILVVFIGAILGDSFRDKWANFPFWLAIVAGIGLLIFTLSYDPLGLDTGEPFMDKLSFFFDTLPPMLRVTLIFLVPVLLVFWAMGFFSRERGGGNSGG